MTMIPRIQLTKIAPPPTDCSHSPHLAGSAVLSVKPVTRWTAVLAAAALVSALAVSASAQVRGEQPAQPVETKPTGPLPSTDSGRAAPAIAQGERLPAPLTSPVQVTIEARFYEVSQNEFELLDFGQYGARVSPLASGGADAPGKALSQILRVGTFDVSAAIKNIPSVELLSSPSVTTLSGQPGKISVGEEMRYPNTMRGGTDGQPPASSSGQPQDFSIRKIGVELETVATVAADGKTIALSVKPTTTKFEGYVEYGGPSVAVASGSSLSAPSGFFQPVFSVRSTQAEVSLQDGATLVVGLSDNEAKRPVLGDIPLIGRLFQSKGEVKEKRALLVFITVIVHKPGANAASTAKTKIGAPAADGN
jgi:Flp pilus assembly secretin CpaC